MVLPVRALLGQDEGQLCPGVALHGGVGHVLADEAGDLPQVTVGLLHHHHVIACPWAEPQEEGEEGKLQPSLAPGSWSREGCQGTAEHCWLGLGHGHDAEASAGMGLRRGRTARRGASSQQTRSNGSPSLPYIPLLLPPGKEKAASATRLLFPYHIYA